MNKDLIPAISQVFHIDLPEHIPLEELKEKLAVHINDLIQSDFEKLVSILYRIDVSESKLKVLLQQNAGNDAGMIIAELIIERQLQKIKSRNENKRSDQQTGDERW